MGINQTWCRVMGILGMLGGLVLFAGDMLFYYNNTNTDLLMNMGQASDTRILLSGISAMVGSWLYMLGLGQVYYAFKPSSTVVRNLVLLCLAGIFIAYGVVHAAYVAIATTAKVAVENQLDIEATSALSSRINDALRWFVYPLFAVASFLFIKQVWQLKTLYPRWVILFFPLIPFLFQSLFDKVLSGTAWVVIMGGYLNWMLVLFFAASTIALWNRTTE